MKKEKEERKGNAMRKTTVSSKRFIRGKVVEKNAIEKNRESPQIGVFDAVVLFDVVVEVAVVQPVIDVFVVER